MIVIWTIVSGLLNTILKEFSSSVVFSINSWCKLDKDIVDDVVVCGLLLYMGVY